MAKRWVAVEKDDDNSCGPCEGVDGTTYRNRADAYRDYPNGVGYKDCVGAKYGNACRGKVVKRRGAEREEDQGMTDIRLLGEFRARLTEHAAILNRQAPSAKEVRGAGDWCRIENAAAEEATVYIFDEIGFWGTTAQGFVDQLNSVTAPKIKVEINSPGGDVFDGLAIHTALATHKAHVTTFVTGIAASAASYIAMAGDNIRMARNATMMIHEASGLVWGNKRDLQKQIDLLAKLDSNIADMYMMQAGGSVEDWLAAMEAETWYTGKEALAAGLVDEITDPDEDPEEGGEGGTQNRSRLSLAAFNFAGRSDAPAPYVPTEPVPEPEVKRDERDHNLAALAAFLR